MYATELCLMTEIFVDFLTPFCQWKEVEVEGKLM